MHIDDCHYLPFPGDSHLIDAKSSSREQDHERGETGQEVVPFIRPQTPSSCDTKRLSEEEREEPNTTVLTGSARTIPSLVLKRYDNI